MQNKNLYYQSLPSVTSIHVTGWFGFPYENDNDVQTIDKFSIPIANGHLWWIIMPSIDILLFQGISKTPPVSSFSVSVTVIKSICFVFLNLLVNRMTSINNLIANEWLNFLYLAYKIKCKELLLLLKTETKVQGVVYFDQRLGAAHAKRWSKFAWGVKVTGYYIQKQKVLHSIT